jgi:hypothetical protein
VRVGFSCAARQSVVVPAEKTQYRLIVYVERSGDATYFLSVLYLMTTLFAMRKLYVSRRAHEGRWEPESIFTASVLFASIIRFLSFATISMLSFENIELMNTNPNNSISSSWSTTSNDEFYTRVTVALFSVGDFVFLTAYMMLVRGFVPHCVSCSCRPSSR